MKYTMTEAQKSRIERLVKGQAEHDLTPIYWILQLSNTMFLICYNDARNDKQVVTINKLGVLKVPEYGSCYNQLQGFDWKKEGMSK